MSEKHSRGPVAWMSRHGVAPNLLMAFLIIGGFLMSLTIRKEFIPATDVDMIIVNVAYPGATPSGGGGQPGVRESTRQAGTQQLHTARIRTTQI